ncbi:peptidoglycan-binding domain-containing protein [Phytohabitans sp. ZYX-F-186]|uniref:Peptidoglycan-binding domain-containing protein n=1 Tax=Phytohabitans maris TaxID=3071409 RepID=A0ABU0ZPM5_9ACTN|nr:peptidoglycan-binding domain-containing protein [Phytohabitans sp. ZYX-F-186]MDQ7908989.1 peptidoglycan-binding domain-containing protein [Phytohabitans sp. ZYX-F-186]
MSGRRRRRTGRVAVAAGVVVVAGAVAATGFGLGLPGGDAPSEASSDLPPATAEVTRQTLVDTQAESGELGYGATISAAARSGGTVTGLPATGSTVERGQALYRLDNAPVVLLYGSLPAYRALAVGTEGADVTQFEKNLKALGYGGFTVDDEYSGATAEAVKEWQEDLGLPETGTVELGRVVFAAGEVRVDSHDAEVGEAVQPGTAVVSYTGTARVVTVELEVADQRLARKGAAVTVTLPDGTETRGKITKTELVIKPAEGQEPASTTVEVTIGVDDAKAVAGLDQATVDVAFTASQRENVLTVPVAALLALAEGGYGVQVVEGAATRIVAVETGMFATGRVEISGDGIAEGVTVGMPS